jgi:hypothetical protein
LGFALYGTKERGEERRGEERGEEKRREEKKTSNHIPLQTIRKKLKENKGELY